MDHFATFALQTAATLIGILVGTLSALALDRRKEARRRRLRLEVVLRSLQLELNENLEHLRSARPVFQKTDWGRSFHISTTAWDTALASSDLPDIIGFGLADALSELYGSLVRLRYYLDLLTRLWMAPRDIEGYDRIRAGFHRAILRAMDDAGHRYDRVTTRIQGALAADRPRPGSRGDESLRRRARHVAAVPNPQCAEV